MWLITSTPRNIHLAANTNTDILVYVYWEIEKKKYEQEVNQKGVSLCSP